jgi:hypothetical protein
MTGLGPVTHDFADISHRKTWVTGPTLTRLLARSVMTRGDTQPAVHFQLP